MKRARFASRVALYTAAALTAALVSGCAVSVGTDSKFGRPGGDLDRIVIQAEDVAGKRALITDEGGWYGMNFDADGTFSADWAKGFLVKKGTWSISPEGNLCLVDPSGRYWIAGDCYEYYGGDVFDEATVLHPAGKPHDSFFWYPVKVTAR